MHSEYITEHETRVLSTSQKLGLRTFSDGRRAIAGQAVVYDTLSEDLGGFAEMIAPGAFTNSLNSQDQLCLFNHDVGKILGRKSAGTLSLRDTGAALEFSCNLPNTSLGRDVAVSCERGDLKGMSFGFICTDDDWQAAPSGQLIRTVKVAELFEISAVALPAYSQSTVSLRSCPASLRGRLQKGEACESDETRIDILRIRRLFQHKMKSI